MYNTETKQLYSDLLSGSFKALGHFADEALRASSPREFFKILSENVVPLIVKSETFEPLYLEWVNEKGIYKKERDKTEKNAIKEITGTFAKLRSTLDTQDLLENPVINKAVSAIEDVLEFREVFAMPPYYEIAYGRLKDLCYRLLELGHIDLVKELGEIIYITKSHVDSATQEITTIQEPHFHHFTFAPSSTKLVDLNKAFSWDEITDIWAVWEYLALAEWCWQTPLSYFDDKELEYEDPDACAQSRFLLNLHSYWAEMNTIKKNVPSNRSVLFFELSRFKNYLKTLLNHILLHQEVHGAPDSGTSKSSPHSIALRLEDNKLLLDVEWHEGGLIEVYSVHKFTGDSALKDFTKDLFASPPDTMLSIEDYASGLSTPKYLERSKLEGVLAEVFFINKSTYKMTLRAKKVYLSEAPKINLIKLREHIKNLTKIGSYPFHTQNPQRKKS